MGITISSLLESGNPTDLAVVDPNGSTIDYACLRNKVEILAHQLRNLTYSWFLMTYCFLKAGLAAM